MKIIIPNAYPARDGSDKEPINQLLSTGLWAKEAEKMLKNTLVFENIRKIGELRKSCGVEPSNEKVIIRRPPRYFPSAT